MKNHQRKVRSRTTEAFMQAPSPNIGIGLRPGNNGHNRLKGNRSQKSKQKMRTHLGMNKEAE